MKKEAHSQAPETDITQEPYKGPSAFIAGLGEGAAAHWGLAAAGLVVGGVAAYVFHKPVNTVIGWLKVHANHRKDAGILKGIGGNIAHYIHEAAHWMTDHIPGHDWMKNKLFKNDAARATATIFGASLSAFVGFFLSPIYFLFTGAKHANEGKNQFERAKEEIRLIRSEHNALHERYAETKLELEDLKTQRAAEQGKLRVAQDDTPNMNPLTPTEPPVPHSATPVIQAEAPAASFVEQHVKQEHPAPKPAKGEVGWSDAIAASKAEAPATALGT